MTTFTAVSSFSAHIAGETSQFETVEDAKKTFFEKMKARLDKINASTFRHDLLRDLKPYEN